ncbi:extracellular calcium-sensing receptor-like [Lissotriton helveticus]
MRSLYLSCADVPAGRNEVFMPYADVPAGRNKSYPWAQGIDFAVAEINQDQGFLPNITLGFRIYDSCLSMARSLKAIMWLLAGGSAGFPNYGCENKSPLAAVIADSGSTESIAIARWLGLYRYPQISYFASSTLLSDRLQFPSFFRTVPSDDSPCQILHYIKHVRFKNKEGEEIFFDHQGNPPERYDIINWQGDSDGAITFVKIGSVIPAVSKGHDMYINDSAIQWGMTTAEVPRSVCSESCAPGYRKAAQDGRPGCCFDCIQCSEGEISNETGSSMCWACPEDQWSNQERNKCIPKNIEFLLYQELLGMMLSYVAIACSLKTLAILAIFIKYANTPVVKANNRELTYLVLGALLLSFLCSFLFIGEPQTITCLLRQPAFGIIFSLCISCVLAKTIMVIIAFKATKPGCNMRRWLGPHVPVVTVSGCTLLQIFICIIWLLLCPPFSEKNMKLKTETIIFQCNECSETALWCMLGYLGLLACVSFLVAFLARTLPDCFNEAKWITFSMLVFLSVWLSFIPGYISTQGKYVVAVEVFAIISSSVGLLSCIFFPKCYIILLRPDLNTRGHLLGKGTSRNKKIKNV